MGEEGGVTNGWMYDECAPPPCLNCGLQKGGMIAKGAKTQHWWSVPSCAHCPVCDGSPVKPIIRLAVTIGHQPKHMRVFARGLVRSQNGVCSTTHSLRSTPTSVNAAVP
jgi:hypothetical protein